VAKDQAGARQGHAAAQGASPSAGGSSAGPGAGGTSADHGGRDDLTVDEAGIQAWRAVLQASNAALRAIEADLDRAGCIPLTWYDVLLELNAAPDGQLRMQDLADRVVLSRTRVSRLADELAAAGLVGKTRPGTDRRVVLASITDAGRQALRATAPHYLRGIQRYFARHLSAADKATVARALTRVSEAGLDLPLSR
jgi:DNA-binding MarR family transcriptional regulator